MAFDRQISALAPGRPAGPECGPPGRLSAHPGRAEILEVQGMIAYHVVAVAPRRWSAESSRSPSRTVDSPGRVTRQWPCTEGLATPVDRGATHRDHDGSTMVVEGVAQAPVSELSRVAPPMGPTGLASVPDAFVEVDGVGVVTEWNPRAEEVFGWRRDEVVGRSIFDTLLPVDRSAHPSSGSISGDGDVPMVRATAAGGNRVRIELVHRAGHRIVGRRPAVRHRIGTTAIGGRVHPIPVVHDQPGRGRPIGRSAVGTRRPACPTGSNSTAG